MDVKDLVDLCKKGDEHALSLLYKNYSEKMKKVCLHYISDPTVAQDLLHDGFIIIFTSIHSLRNPEKLEIWMKIIMKNISLRYLNQTNAAPSIPLTDISEQEEPLENPSSPNFISYDKMLGMVERLPEGYSRVFKLSILEGLSHQEIGNLLGIAPHSSSSQLSRAKVLLRKMLKGYRVVTVLALLFLLPMLYDYLHKEKRGIVKGIRPSEVTAHLTATGKETDKEDIALIGQRPRSNEPRQEKIAAVRPTDSLPAVLPLTIPETEDSASRYRIINPFSAQSVTKENRALPYSFSQTTSLLKKKSGKWKVMLAGSLGPQLAQSLYKLMATPPSDATSGHLPQQVGTWEEYYTYLNTRYEEGTLNSDSIGLMQVARNNSGRIVEQQHHDAPVTVGFSLSKKLNDRWSLETGLNYTYLKSEFTTGEEFRIQETQKLHYIGIPLRLSYRFWNYKRFSTYASAGMQIDIPVKGTLHTFHTTDSVPNLLGSKPIAAPIQWSVNTSVGVQYHVTPRTSIYLEPTVNYYIPDGSELRTIRKEHPFTFTIPVGIRFTW